MSQRLSSSLEPLWNLEAQYAQARRPLNAKQIEKWRPDASRILELVDGAVEGLRVRLTPKGTMTWSLSVRVNGERRRLNLGKGLGLTQAREAQGCPGKFRLIR